MPISNVGVASAAAASAGMSAFQFQPTFRNSPPSVEIGMSLARPRKVCHGDFNFLGLQHRQKAKCGPPDFAQCANCRSAIKGRNGQSCARLPA
jgi:hypothetical protein